MSFHFKRALGVIEVQDCVLHAGDLLSLPCDGGLGFLGDGQEFPLQEFIPHRFICDSVLRSQRSS